MGKTARLTLTGNTTFVVPAGVNYIRAFPQQTYNPIGSSGNSTLLLAADNNVYAWGDNTHGQLGIGSQVSASSPTLIQGGASFKQLIQGGGSTLGITFDGQLYSWGSNFSGELGDGTMLAKSSPVLVLGGLHWVAASASSTLNAAIDATGKIYCWGAGSNGELGSGTAPGAYSSPVLVAGVLPLFKQVIASAPAGSMWALGVNGVAYAWGNNAFGQLGVGDLVSRSSPVLIAGGLTFASLSSGVKNTSCFGLTPAGLLYAWGDNFLGLLGVGSLVNVSSPVLVAGGHSYSQVVCSDTNAPALNNFTLALGLNNVIYAWGSNSAGQLGIGNVANQSTPVVVLGLPAKTWIQVAVKYDTSYALASDGTVYAWGGNVAGQVGDGTVVPKSSPVLVLGGISFGQLIQASIASTTLLMLAQSNGQLYG